MICTRLTGGLGNQLFQYAAGRALAARHGCDLLLDDGPLRRQARNVTPRQPELHHFRHVGRWASEAQRRRLRWLPRLAPLSRWISPWRTAVEQGLGYNASFASWPDGTYLVGYWQSPRYFASIAPALAAELEPAAPLSPTSQAVATRMGSGGAPVAVHVRRGDYVSLPAAAELHGALGVPYYAAALQRVREAVGPGARYHVFSDDVAWCRANLPLAADETVYVDHNGGADAWQDLILMAQCHHHVIANSSFSWWGAWLADQRRAGQPRLVVAPSRWFAGQPEQDLRDRFPAHWVVQP